MVVGTGAEWGMAGALLLSTCLSTIVLDAVASLARRVGASAVLVPFPSQHLIVGRISLSSYLVLLPLNIFAGTIGILFLFKPDRGLEALRDLRV